MVLLVPHSYRNALVRGVAFKCGQAILSYQRVEIGAEIAASRLRARSSALADHRVSRRQVVSHVKELGGHHEQAISVLVFAIAVLSASMALAQSSGNFDAAVNPTVCTLNSNTGTLSPLCTPTVDGTECVLLDTTIKTSNGNGVTLLITPSAVTGLFTSTKLSSTVNTATADIGIKVCVQVAGGHS